MRTFGVAVDAIHLNGRLRFHETVKYLATRAFVPEFAVEGFTAAVLPR